MQLRPSKIEDYGEYAWTKGSPERLHNIPKLPDELFDMIRSTPPPTPTTSSPRVAPATPATPTTSTTKELQDLKALCCCLFIAQLDKACCSRSSVPL